jgi:(p)ppGpp synthase/HD superfamily hydrolase
MTDFNTFYEALKFATKAHGPQLDRDGLPYILHPARVAEQFVVRGDFRLAISAVLHDVVEDTATTLDEIRETFGKRVAEIVDRVSRRKSEGETYAQFIERVCGDQEAIQVKLADVRDNLYRRGPCEMEKRYLKAISTLSAAAKHPQARS